LTRCFRFESNFGHRSWITDSRARGAAAPVSGCRGSLQRSGRPV